jgi:hypothetical protein
MPLERRWQARARRRATQLADTVRQLRGDERVAAWVFGLLALGDAKRA